MTTGQYKYDFKADMPTGVDWNDYFKEFNRYFADEMAKSTALPDGLHVGKIFSIGVADGHAYYEIVKILKTSVRIICRDDLCPDKWQDHHFGGGGTFSKRDVARYVGFEDGMRKIFGTKK